MNAPLVKAPWRIAFRSEGEYVNCYFADEHTMEGAMLLGSLKRSLAELGAFQPWRELMQEAMRAVTQDALGVACEFPDEPHPAPEHERAGRG
jgi:hypothetical protein